MTKCGLVDPTLPNNEAKLAELLGSVASPADSAVNTSTVDAVVVGSRLDAYMQVPCTPSVVSAHA